MKKIEIMKKIQEICLRSKNVKEIMELIGDSQDRDLSVIREVCKQKDIDFRYIWNITYNFTRKEN